jgi:ATP-binding cassette subfamily B protein
MRSHSSALPPPVDAGPAAPRSDWITLRKLLPYLWRYRWRVGIALAFLVGAKVANVGVPILLKHLVDALSIKPGDARAVLVVPIGLLLAYGALRLSTSLFTELRELVFAKATEGTARSISLAVFRHLHDLSLRFHLERQTGGMTRDIERGTRAVHSLISYSIYSIVPTLIEVTMVLTLLAVKFDAWFAGITGAALVLYIAFTVAVTEWRTKFRRQMNELDSTAHTKAIDSLLNYETVKYFNNEDFEARRYDQSLEQLRRAALKSQTTLSILNTGQQLIIAFALVAMLWRATEGVVAARLTLGDLVMINAFMIQLYIPLNFLGVVYREIKQNLTDLDRMFRLLEREREVADAPDARPLAVEHGAVRFEHVSFAYDPARPILHDLTFDVPAGKTVAVVGPSGAGKSTLARLLYRFYDVSGGRIAIDGQDVRAVTQSSLRAAIGIVPQDTVLFNDTIGYNIAYGRAGASLAEDRCAAWRATTHGRSARSRRRRVRSRRRQDDVVERCGHRRRGAVGAHAEADRERRHRRARGGEGLVCAVGRHPDRRPRVDRQRDAAVVVVEVPIHVDPVPYVVRKRRQVLHEPAGRVDAQDPHRHAGGIGDELGAGGLRRIDGGKRPDRDERARLAAGERSVDANQGGHRERAVGRAYRLVLECEELLLRRGVRTGRDREARGAGADRVGHARRHRRAAKVARETGAQRKRRVLEVRADQGAPGAHQSRERRPDEGVRACLGHPGSSVGSDCRRAVDAALGARLVGTARVRRIIRVRIEVPVEQHAARCRAEHRCDAEGAEDGARGRATAH